MPVCGKISIHLCGEAHELIAFYVKKEQQSNLNHLSSINTQSTYKEFRCSQLAQKKKKKKNFHHRQGPQKQKTPTTILLILILITIRPIYLIHSMTLTMSMSTIMIISSESAGKDNHAEIVYEEMNHVVGVLLYVFPFPFPFRFPFHTPQTFKTQLFELELEPSTPNR